MQDRTDCPCEPVAAIPASVPSGSESTHRPTIAVVHASVGSGHRAAANAIAQAIEQLRGLDGVPQDVQVDVLDILDFGKIKFDGNKTAAAFTGATRPLYDVTWRFTLTGRLLWGGGSAWSTLMFDSFDEYVQKARPLAIICTHITAANVAVGARMRTKIEYPVVCVPTDYEIEGFWPHKEADLFCVATEFMAETLRPRKVPESAIEVTGIPVRSGFGDSGRRDADRKRFGLPANKTLVLVMAALSLSLTFALGRQLRRPSPIFEDSRTCTLSSCPARINPTPTIYARSFPE